MDEQKQDNQLEPTYTRSLPMQNVALKTWREQWMIEKGGGSGSGRFVLMAWHDDDDIIEKKNNINESYWKIFLLFVFESSVYIPTQKKFEIFFHKIYMNI